MVTVAALETKVNGFEQSIMNMEEMMRVLTNSVGEIRGELKTAMGDLGERMSRVEQDSATHLQGNHQTQQNQNRPYHHHHHMDHNNEQEEHNSNYQERREFSKVHVKLEFPKFKEGDDPIGWIYKAEQYFAYYKCPVESKVQIASFHLEGEVLQWFQWLDCTQNYPEWGKFTDILCETYGSVEYEDCLETLAKLKQTESLEEYQKQFRRFAIRTQGLTDDMQRSFFIGGLKDELRYDVKFAKPKSVVEAFNIAQQLDKKIKAQHNNNRSTYSNNTKGNNTFKGKTPEAQRIPHSSNPTSNYEVKKLTPAQMGERAKLGLCFNCDEKWVRGHKCTKKTLFLIDGDWEEEHIDIRNDTEEESPEITLHALNGSLAYQEVEDTTKIQPKTLRVQGHIKNCPIIILLDSGSSHNFISNKLVKRLKLAKLPMQDMKVTIANGGKLESTGICSGVKVKLGTYEFQTDLITLELGGCELVLGAQWLMSISPVLWDFKRHNMKFEAAGQMHILWHYQSKPCNEVSALTMEKLLGQQDNVKYLCMISMQDNASGQASQGQENTDIQKVLRQYLEVFSEPSGLPPNRCIDHHIPLKSGSEPTNIRPYRYGPIQKSEIERQVKDLLKSGFVQPSVSPFSSPVLLVKKKDSSWRMCVDYRALNQATIKDKYPIPIIDELLDELQGAHYFSKIDLRSGYHQIRMNEHDIPKTAFRTHDGHYEFLVMPFGLTNAPATFQGLMNDLFRPHLRRYILVFFDDILIYSKDWYTHLQHIDSTLQILKENQLHAKESKCVWGAEKLEYLGHLISRQGVAVDPAKIQAMVDWPVPKTLKALRGFLGLTGYYRKFIKHYGVICKPLTDLLKKDAFHWNEEAQQAFEILKVTLTTTPVLALPNFQEPFTIESDACGVGIGAVLMQKGQPIAFFSKALGPKSGKLSIYEKEMLAIMQAIQKWENYLVGNHFVIKTDHQSLKYFLEAKATTSMQQKWIAKTMGMDFEITYKKGIENKVADALSRLPEQQLMAISYPYYGWMDELRRDLEKDTWIQTKAGQLDQGEGTNNKYSVDNGFLRYKKRIMLSPTSKWKSIIMQEMHATASAGHSGYLKTYKRIYKTFYWTGMKSDIKLFIKECAVCQLHKHETIAPPGLLQPLPIPQGIWQDISMDFVDGLSSSKGKTTIMVVVDRLSKYAHFIALSHPYTAQSVAQEFISNIFKLHGMPSTIVSDRDTVFTSKFWKELFKLQGTKLCMSSGYHPQSDGQTEVVNRCLEAYLRCFVSDKPSQWVSWLPWAEWWYNTSYHTSTKFTPYEVVYGQLPPHLYPYEPGTTKLHVVDEYLKEREEVLSTLKQHLTQAQDRMKTQADKNRTEREFTVGDFVYLKTIPYKQSSLASHTVQKLAPKFCGPFEVLARVGSVAYKLKLPEEAKIHPVMHVSRLKKHVGLHVSVSPHLPQIQGDFSPAQIKQPASVIARRPCKINNRSGVELLIRWEGEGEDGDTWVEIDKFQKKFPDFLI